MPCLVHRFTISSQEVELCYVSAKARMNFKREGWSSHLLLYLSRLKEELCIEMVYLLASYRPWNTYIVFTFTCNAYFFFIMWHQYETQLCFLSHERIPVHVIRPCVNIDMKISTDIDSIFLVVGRSRCDKLWRMSYVCHFEKHLHRQERNEIYIATNASILSHAFTF